MVNSFQDIFSKENKKSKKKIIQTEKIIIDFRERNSLVPAELKKLGIDFEFKQLKVGDYLVGRKAIERKTFQDLISSMINKRIFRQMEELKQFPQKLLMVEGYDYKKFYDQGVNPNAIRGLLLSIALKYGVPLIFTKDSEETALYLRLIANKKEKEFSLNVSKRNLSPNEELQFILEAFPNIGPIKAKALLEKNKSLKKIFYSSEEELEKILGKKAKEFKKIIERDYSSPGTKAKKL